MQEDVAKTLENFWLEIADTISPTTLPYKIRSSMAAAHSMMHGNLKAFVRIMVMPGIPAYYFPFDYPYFYSTEELKHTFNKYIDFKVFANNNKSDKSTSNNVRTNSETNKQDDRNYNVITAPRLILNCTDMQRGKLVTFDSQTTNITADHIAACTDILFWHRLEQNKRKLSGIICFRLLCQI